MVGGEVVMNGSSTDSVNDAKTTSPASSTVFFFLSWHSPLCSSFLCTASEQILQNILYCLQQRLHNFLITFLHYSLILCNDNDSSIIAIGKLIHDNDNASPQTDRCVHVAWAGANTRMCQHSNPM